MRGDATYTLDVDFGADSVWGVQRYFAEQLAFFDRWLQEDGGGAPDGRGAGADLRDGRRLGPEDRARQARPRRPLARGARVAARAGAVEAIYHLHGDGSLVAGGASGRRRSRAASPTTRRIRCRRSAASTARSASCRRRARGWSRRGRASSARCCGCATSSRPARPTRRRRPSSSPPASLPAALGARRRARLRDRAARGAGRGDRPRAGEPVGLVERRRHRLHREARRRLPAERGLPGRLRHADQRLDHPLPLPRGLRAGGLHGARRGGAGHDRAAADERTSSTAATGSGSTSRRRTSRGSTGTRTPASRSAGTRTRSSPSRRSHGGHRSTLPVIPA